MGGQGRGSRVFDWSLRALPPRNAIWTCSIRTAESWPMARLLRSTRECRNSAEQGDTDAQFNLGLCYHKGGGVARTRRLNAFGFARLLKKTTLRLSLSWVAAFRMQGRCQGPCSRVQVLVASQNCVKSFLQGRRRLQVFL